MQPNQPDQAIVLKDPAGEQTALFDTTQGGALVSLKYRGVEHIWGYNGGGLLQIAFHNRRDNGSIAGDYNPTQAGDGSAMSPVTGIACVSRIVTDLAIIDVTPDGLAVVEIVDGLPFDELQRLTGVPLRAPRAVAAAN